MARTAAPIGRHVARPAPRKRPLPVAYHVDRPRVRLRLGGVSVAWQADLAAGLAGVPVLAALGGTRAVVGALVLSALVAVVAACTPGGARLPGAGGRIAGLAILLIATIPAIAGASVVLVRSESRAAALVLLLLVSAYEMGDFIVGSGASNPVEGPLAGITTAMLLALPLAVLLVAPFDDAGAPLLGFAAAACPLGQVMASAMLPDAGATAPARRRGAVPVVANRRVDDHRSGSCGRRRCRRPGPRRPHLLRGRAR